MPDALVLPDSIAGRADVLPPAFVCAWRDGGLDAAWVHVVGELDIATTPQLERTLAQAQLPARLVVLDLRGLAFMDSSGVHAIAWRQHPGSAGRPPVGSPARPPDVDRISTLSGNVDVEIYDLDPVEPPAHVLLRLAGEELAS